MQRYDVTSTEQAKVIAHPLRLQILGLFNDAVPRTSKQLADLLELAPAKVHYHVRELLRAELIQLVDTKEKGGIIEKYYLPIAKEYRIILKENGNDSGSASAAKHSILNNMMDEYKRSFIKAIELSDQHKEERKDQLSPSIRSYNFMLNDQEFMQLQSELEEVLERWMECSHTRTDAKCGDSKAFRLLLSHYEKKQLSKKSSNIKID